jgi:transposase
VLVGGSQRRGGQEPYTPVVEALAGHLQAAGPEQRRAALAGCGWLVRLLPELAADLEPVPAGGLAPEQERRLLFAAVARLLANLAGPAGTLLVLDDLQWAGSDALDLLAGLLRSSTVPLHVVGAYRDTEVRPADPLGLLLADLAQARLVRQHALGPLAPQEAANLLDNLLVDLAASERGQVAGVLRQAGGAPFFLISYAQALHQGSAVGVPWDLAQGVQQRVALLPPTGQDLLGAAAVIGRHAARALLEAVAGQPEEAVVAGLEAACRARLLVEDGAEAYAFAHDVIREVVEADLSTARRALLHRKAAEALEGDPAGAPSELLAYHCAHGGILDKAVVYLERAGDHAWAQRAHAAAEGHYREALDRLEGLGHVQDALRLREKLGELLYRAGRYDAAIQVLEPAAEALRAVCDWAGLVRVTVWIGRAHFRRGTPSEGIARLMALLELLERSGASSHAAVLLLGLGQLLFAAGQYGESLTASERAIELARAGGDDRTRLLATLVSSWNRMHLAQMQGRLGEALRLGEDVLRLVEALGEREGLLMAHRDLAYSYALQGAVATGQGHLARARALAEQLGDPGQLAFTLALHGWLALLGGDWPGARADLDQALALSRQVDRSVLAVYPLILRARLSLTADEQEIATTSAQEALALAESHDNLQALRWAAAVVAEIDVLEGRPAAASARLLPLLDGPDLQDPDVTALLPVLAWAQLEQGLLAQASELVDQALARARPEGMRLVLVDVLRVQALVALRRGQGDEAARSLEEGIALARSLPWPYAEARLLHVGSLLHVAQGEPQAARDRLATAQAIFARLGARMDRARVEQELGALSQNDGRGCYETVVSNAQWAQVQALLPPPARTGRRRADDRRTLEAILYQRRTGCAWAALPAAYGDEATAHRRLRQWQADGLWEQIAAIVQPAPAGGHGQEDNGPGYPALAGAV